MSERPLLAEGNPAIERRNVPGRVDLAVKAALSGAMLAASFAPRTSNAGELPVPSALWVSSGAATSASAGNTLTINQSTNSATLNWQSFNIGRENTVNFNQPTSDSVALNKIFQADPTRILGALNANGQVYLINQNGIVFGEGAQVNVRGLVASSLSITPAAEELGIARALTERQQAAFAADGNGTRGDVRVEKGAHITTPEGGRVLLFGSNVTNEGNISTPGGQTALAAGEKVYLRSSDDENLRGLFVEVEKGGTVTNGSTQNSAAGSAADLIGQIGADRGNVTLVGLAVNQLGLVSAKTAIRSNGSIRLLARESTVNQGNTIASRGGTLTLGANSVTDANPDVADHSTTLDSNTQPRAQVDLRGNLIQILSSSALSVKGGNVNALASKTGTDSLTQLEKTDVTASRVIVESGSRIDVSGMDVTLPAERNALTVKLQGSELKDSPVQRDSPLRGATVTVDVRKMGVHENGEMWIGAPLADLREAARGVQRDVAERNSSGGTISLGSQGDVILSGNSTIDVSGGSLTYSDGQVRTTKLIRQGQLYDITTADPNLVYDGVFGTAEVAHKKWGVVEVFNLLGGTPLVSAGGGGGGYVEGRDAGQITISSPRMILDGSLVGSVNPGKFQRQLPDTSLPPGDFRAFDQAPRAGRLILGDSSALTVLPDVLIQSGAVLPSLPGFNPLTDPLPETMSSVRVDPNWFGQNKLQSLSIASNRKVELPAGVALDLGAGGALDIHAGAATIDGEITAHSGSVDIAVISSAGVGLRLGSASSIDVSGLWFNDSRLLKPEGPAGGILAYRGGRVTIAATQGTAEAGGLDFQAGSRIDASGSGWVTAKSKLVAGQGGEISLTARSADGLLVPSVSLAGAAVAFGVEDGGTLNLTLPGVCISATTCSGDSADRFTLRPEFFRSGGFSHYRVTSENDGMTVAASTVIQPQQQNFILDPDATQQPDGANIREFSTVGILGDLLRNPTDIDLAVRIRRPVPAFSDAEMQQDRFASVLEAGASIRTELGGNVTIASDTRMVVDGSIEARGGDINLTLTSGFFGGSFAEFSRSQTLRLGSSAQLTTAGFVLVQPNDAGLRQGTVSNSGNVTIEARSGYVVVDQGALIDVSGVAATLDILPAGSSVPRAVQVAADAGQISLKGAEGILFNGEMRAQAAIPGGRAGGLLVELDAQQRNDDTGDVTRTAALLGLPTGPRQIVISSQFAPTVVGRGSSMPESLDGLAMLSDDQINRGGFGDITFHARNLFRLGGDNTQLTVPGSVRFEGSVDISATRRLTVDSSSIVAGTQDAISLRAPYVALGNSADALQSEFQATPPLVPGGGRLSAVAGQIDFVGALRLNGFASSEFSSSGDIRLRGVRIGSSARTFVGSLESTGDITYTASQVYPTTLTEFAVAVRDNPEGRITVQAAGVAQPVLSAGGKLTMEAANITQAGVLKVPLGSLTLSASDELILAPGSLTSTSLEGAVVPFGRVELGKDWVYSIDPNEKLVFKDQNEREADLFPQQFLRLDGDKVTLSEGAVVDQSGSGDLLAYEFQQGLAGSFDVLDPEESPNLFAILPASSLLYAPIDPQEQRTFGLEPGQSIELGGGATGLPAGRYALLPARYALLPGAWLVQAVDGYQDLSPGTSVSQPGGGNVVAGRHVFANGVDGDSRSSGFLVRPGTDSSKFARYDLHRANSFSGLAVDRLPRDGGVTQIAALSSLDIAARLQSAAGAGGRGAQVEITGQQLALVRDKNNHTADSGSLLIDAGSLSSFGAESILIGGTRKRSADSIELDVTTQLVEVDQGAVLQAPEVILAATDTVRVEGGAIVRGSGSGSGSAETLRTSGDGALLRVASKPQIRLERTPGTTSGSAGILDIEQGATLAADTSTLLDATLDTRLEGRVQQQGGSLSLSASRISLGQPDTDVNGLTLTNADLAALTVSELSLTSRSSIDFYGAVDLSAQRLYFETAGLQAMQSGGDVARLSADVLTLANTNSALLATDPPAGTGGQLELAARMINLGAGDVSVLGFDRTTLTASEAIVAATRSAATTAVMTAPSGGTPSLPPPTKGMLNVAGDLALIAGRITGTTGSDLRIDATGSVRTGTASPGAALTPVRDLGAKLSIAGSDVHHAGRIDMPSGVVELAATGTQADDHVITESGSVINVAGTAELFADKLAFASAGSVRLGARAGNVLMQAGSTVDLSGSAEGGDAGKLALSAPNGTVDLAGAIHAGATPTYRAGSVTMDAHHVSNFSLLNDAFNAAHLDFERNLRARTGDITIARQDVVRAQKLDFTADSGSITVAGSIDARADNGGVVELNARNSVVVLGTGAIDAAALGTGNRGGRIALRSTSQGVSVQSGARLSVAAAADSSLTADQLLDQRGGTVDIRVSRDAALTLADGNSANDMLALRGTILGSRRTTVEAYRAYEDADGQIDATDVSTAGNPRFDEAIDFITANGATIRNGLGIAETDLRFHLVPGVEIVSSDPNTMLALGANWDLSQWRFNGEPGVLTLRAAGDLRFDASLSDGFQGMADLSSAARPILLQEESWAYRLIAGADISSADATATVNLDSLHAGTGNVVIAAGIQGTTTAEPRATAIRTGTGSIEIAAARDFTLTNGASVLYTAGLDSQRGIPLGAPSARGTLGGRPYPEGGGDVRIRAGGNVNGVAPELADNLSEYSGQLIMNWLFRQGSAVAESATNLLQPTGWTVAFEHFAQGVAALGGGDVEIFAGGDISNLSASIPTIGRQVGGTTADTSLVEVLGGGNLSVEASGGIGSGVYYVGRGHGRIRAGSDITSTRPLSASDSAPLYTLLAVGEGTVDVQARGTVNIEAIVNPTVLPQSAVQKQTLAARGNSYFFTYRDDSGVELQSLTEDVVLHNKRAELSQQAGPFLINFTNNTQAGGSGDESLSLVAYPPRLTAQALRGNVDVLGSFTLFPSATGTIELLADQSVNLSADFSLSDADRSQLPSMNRPFPTFRSGSALDPSGSQLSFALTPNHAASADEAPARIVARSGDIVGANLDAGVFLSKHALLSAGNDIRDLKIIIQNIDAKDETRIAAFRDIVFNSPRAAAGGLLANNNGIDVQGPGRLQLESGRDLDLGTSRGITSLGNTRNPALAEDGAAITTLVGLNGHAPDYAGFVARYLQPGGLYEKQIAEYTRQYLGKPQLSTADAIVEFMKLPVSAQRPVIYAAYFNELRETGRKNAPLPDAQREYKRGFDAIKTLFPAEDYSGSASLFFSRLYTLDGGDINLFAPGGFINVGLAAPPLSFGIDKEPSELGIVAQGTGDINAFLKKNFDVNESRVFAADGGNVLVWSSDGDIDAGRGAKSSISAPPPVISVDPETGAVTVKFPPALTGSGIRTLTSTPGRKFGSIDLYTPRGVVNASEAGIETLGNLTIAAREVLGTGNIKVGGLSTGVPVDTGGLGASLASVSSVASGASEAAETSVSTAPKQSAPLADTALGWLEVFVEGFGEEVCKPNDAECLKRQQKE